MVLAATWLNGRKGRRGATVIFCGGSEDLCLLRGQNLKIC